MSKEAVFLRKIAIYECSEDCESIKCGAIRYHLKGYNGNKYQGGKQNGRISRKI